jgi:hypothetical protein
MLTVIGYVAVAAVFYLVGKLGRDSTNEVYAAGFEAGWEACDESEDEV